MQATARPHPPEISDTFARADVQSRKRVLVVDDEPGIGSVMRRILGRVHDVVVHAAHRQALRAGGGEAHKGWVG